jgi:hypothetical protein
VEERGRPERAIVAVAAREIEGLERVVERIPFGMPAGILLHAVEREQELEEILVHGCRA